MAKSAIKCDNRKQNLLLPPSLDELVPENHTVRVVDAAIDRLDISDILSTYRGGGNSAFNPKMMLKVLVFAYLSNVYSLRRIEELLRRDIYFMWLACMKQCGSNKKGGGSYGKGEIYMPIEFTARLSQVSDSRERPPRLNLHVIACHFNYYNSETILSR